MQQFVVAVQRRRGRARVGRQLVQDCGEFALVAVGLGGAGSHTHIAPQPDSTFEVTLSTGESVPYDAALVANGHHWDPRLPDPMWPGAAEFTGEIMHSHAYAEDAQLVGKRCLDTKSRPSTESCR
ncbi:hypothetical protein ACFWPK_09315 [Nocardia sp. NPDC058519]|uniref:hypothetical protein n=1 Tax=Nocardia sp. NPDC058519 TaxID=3346535 RepID=UPI0036595626